MENQPTLTVCVPCFGRPQRTKRIVEQIVSQRFDGCWEAFVIGDCCPDFQNLMDEGFFADMQKRIAGTQNALIVSNMPMHGGGCGYVIRNKVKELANGQYFIYVDNDDCIEPNHFQNYVDSINGTDLDFAYHDVYVDCWKHKRNAMLQFGSIGHAELVIRTEYLKQMPPHGSEYGHDWQLIQAMIDRGAKYMKFDKQPTYKVMSLPNFKETGID